MNTVATAVLLAASLAGVATPANAVIDTPSASSPVSYYIDDPAPQPPPSPGDTSLPLPLPVGSQGVPPEVEVYCPGLPWIHDCHQCLGDPAHQCWNRWGAQIPERLDATTVLSIEAMHTNALPAVTAQ